MKMDKQEEKEMEMLLNEIPYATSPPFYHHQRHHLRDAPDAHHSHLSDDVLLKHQTFLIRDIGNGILDAPSAFHALYHGNAYDYGNGSSGGHACWSPPPFLSEGSSASGSLSGTFSPDGDDVGWRSPDLGRHLAGEEEHDLLAKLGAVRLGDDWDVPAKHSPMTVSGFENNSIDPYLFQTSYGESFVMDSPMNGAFVVPKCSALPESLLFDSVSRPNISSFTDMWLDSHGLDAPISHSSSFHAVSRKFPHGEEVPCADGAFSRIPYHMGGGLGCPPSFNLPSSISEAVSPSHPIGVDPNWDLNTLNSAGLVHSELSRLGYNIPLSNEYAGLSQDSWDSRLQLLRNQQKTEAFRCEDSLILQGKGLHFVGNQSYDCTTARKRLQLSDCLNSKGSSAVNMDSLNCGGSPRLHKPPTLPLKYDNLIGVKGCIYYIAKDQHGCRFLQQKFDEGRHQVDVVFDGIIDHVAELMMNQFGNYLMQKLLEVCTEEQRMKIILVLTKDPTELIKISLNTHGTRAVQKLIGALKTRQQIALVVSALQPGFLDLIKDLNGNHVIQRCLQSLKSHDNKFIFDAAATHCVDIAKHRHGCCVLQRCIDNSSGEDRAKLVAEISANGFELAQDAFGNYVVQYVLDLEIPLAIANLASQFEGRYVQLSMQKFSSNVVEKCLKVFTEDGKAAVILELLSFSQFEELLQDPYANYVIQSALQNSKDSLHAALVEAIRPHAPVLRTSPYSKRIFSRGLSRK
ncbi:uncharacterized protein [Typha latifolia]|uniref:uncharacterized protein n=1 Tax=Typha latifolia TaxID=4733 RepID=UPI003C2C3493